MITLASDFPSPYPAAMKGAVLEHTDAQLVDVAHDLPRHDVRAAAFWLGEVLPYFPPAVHLVVVDPGVGTDRAAVALRAGNHALVGPDNGVLAPAARRLADRTADAEHPPDSVDAFRIDPREVESSTFHGRDVFAPAAGQLHERGFGEFLELEYVTPTHTYEDLRLPTPDVEGQVAEGEVLVVDGFGNVITNVPGWFLEDVSAVQLGDHRIPVVEAYAAVEAGAPLATVGSHDNVELDINRGRGDEVFDLSAGDPIRLEAEP